MSVLEFNEPKPGSCENCGREIPPAETGYFELDLKTDRFKLACRYCQTQAIPV